MVFEERSTYFIYTIQFDYEEHDSFFRTAYDETFLAGQHDPAFVDRIKRGIKNTRQDRGMCRVQN